MTPTDIIAFTRASLRAQGMPDTSDYVCVVLAKEITRMRDGFSPGYARVCPSKADLDLHEREPL